MMFTEKDIRQICSHGLTEDAVDRQLRNFRAGFPYLNISSAATIDNGGIRRTSSLEREGLAAQYERYAANHKIVKFVPASGAATRMFRELFEFVLTDKPNKVTNEALVNIEKFAFYELLEKYVEDTCDAMEVISAIVSGSGLNYGITPKALIIFHKYEHELRTALEEHLVEGAGYASCGGNVNIHFTVSPEHRFGFQELLAQTLARYEDRYGVSFNIGMSEQKSSTDTIAVDMNNNPWRGADGRLLFRPAGHGALIENLNDIDADVVFIKNIDNVTTDSRRADTIEYKKVLAGLLVTLQERAFGYLRELEKGNPTAARLQEISEFIEEELCVNMPTGVEGNAVMYASILNRPIRVCGMVRNEGEPGGGPFWVRNADGTVSLQIAEPNQIDPDESGMLREGTHFNPVDLVCGLRDYKGNKFDLGRYVDPHAGFISEKSKDGRALKAQELPGLWNGAMSSWNTVFVEVPVTTFSPVKVVTDLLRPEHQS